MKGNTEVNTGSTKGIPDFWLNVLKSVEVTADMIQECDDDVLKHLNDITIALSQNPMVRIMITYVCSYMHVYSCSGVHDRVPLQPESLFPQ